MIRSMISSTEKPAAGSIRRFRDPVHTALRKDLDTSEKYTSHCEANSSICFVKSIGYEIWTSVIAPS